MGKSATIGGVIFSEITFSLSFVYIGVMESVITKSHHKFVKFVVLLGSSKITPEETTEASSCLHNVCG